MNYHVRAYTSNDKALWNECVRKARQSSFLFEREFMDYHADRYHDASLFLLNNKEETVALLPACVSRVDRLSVESHGGLTYGGLLLMPGAMTVCVGECLPACVAYYKSQGFKNLLYKPLPHIYHNYPAEEDLYWLYRFGAVLEARAVSAVIDLRKAYTFSTLRQRKVRKACKLNQLQLHERIDYLPHYWQILQNVLEERHQTAPVHTFAEMQRLMQEFPERITLHVVTTLLAEDGLDEQAQQEKVVAGCILFHTDKVKHVQYIATNEKGREMGALDWLFANLISSCKDTAQQTPYFDFGISTENKGRYLNEGLIFQKEGFGARAVCYDAYRLNFED